MNEFDLLTPSQKAWIIECWSCFPEFEHYAAANCADALEEINPSGRRRLGQFRHGVFEPLEESTQHNTP